MRRCFARVLLLMNLVGEESPRCLALSADADKKLVFGVDVALRGAAYEVFGDSESALLICNRLSEGAERMSLPKGQANSESGSAQTPHRREPLRAAMSGVGSFVLALFADRDALVDRRADDEGAFIAEFVVRASAEGDSERRVGAVVEYDAGF